MIFCYAKFKLGGEGSQLPTRPRLRWIVNVCLSYSHLNSITLSLFRIGNQYCMGLKLNSCFHSWFRIRSNMDGSGTLLHPQLIQKKEPILQRSEFSSCSMYNWFRTTNKYYMDLKVSSSSTVGLEQGTTKASIWHSFK
jgi:hypothetical protein